MYEKDVRGNEKLPFASQWGLLFASLSLLAFLMYFSYTYPSVSGPPASLRSFIAFWFRELLLLVFLAITIIVAAAWKLITLARRVFQGDEYEEMLADLIEQLGE